MQNDENDPGSATGESPLEKVKQAPGEAVRGITEAVKGPPDGSRSASSAGSPGYVDNRENDEAAADADPAGPADS